MKNISVNNWEELTEGEQNRLLRLFRCLIEIDQEQHVVATCEEAGDGHCANCD